MMYNHGFQQTIQTPPVIRAQPNRYTDSDEQDSRSMDGYHGHLADYPDYPFYPDYSSMYTSEPRHNAKLSDYVYVPPTKTKKLPRSPDPDNIQYNSSAPSSTSSSHAKQKKLPRSPNLHHIHHSSPELSSVSSHAKQKKLPRSPDAHI